MATPILTTSTAHKLQTNPWTIGLRVLALLSIPTAGILAADSAGTPPNHKPSEKTGPAQSSISTATPSRVPGREEKSGATLQVPPNLKLSEEMLRLIDQYRTQAEAHVATQRSLIAQMRGATQEQWVALKEQIRTSQELFMEETAHLRMDLHERLTELKSTLQESAALEAGVQDPNSKGRRGGK